MNLIMNFYDQCCRVYLYWLLLFGLEIFVIYDLCILFTYRILSRMDGHFFKFIFIYLKTIRLHLITSDHTHTHAHTHTYTHAHTYAYTHAHAQTHKWERVRVWIFWMYTFFVVTDTIHLHIDLWQFIYISLKNLQPDKYFTAT